MAVQASEYRRINGVRRLIGRIQHEVAFIVTDCGPDNVPNPVIVTAQPGANARVVNTPDTTQISVYTCQLSRIKLDFTDPDNLRTPSAQQPLTVTMPADINTNPLLLDAGDVGTFSLSGNGTAHPVGTLLLQPAATAAGRIIRLNVRVEDNACPVKARQNRVIVIKVLRGNFARATATTTAGGGTTLVYPGDTLLLQGRTLRPDSVRNIAAGTTLRQTYNYQWSVRGDGLNPTQSTGATIRIAPTVTSRYGLTVMPQLGLAQGACFDTTSVLVTVQPAPVLPPNIVRNGTTLTSSAPTGNQWYLNGQPISGATGQTYTAAAVGTYTVRVTVVVGSRSYTTPPSAPVTLQALAAQHALPGTSVAVTPNPTHDGRLNVVLTGYSQPVALTVLDGLGRTVTHASTAATGAQGTSTLPLDLSALPAGLYLLQVRAGTGLETRRIVRE